jgi:carboxymethylenebutenolidase
MHETVQIQTADGTCPAHAFTPSSGTGPWPGAIVYMDALAIRPALFALGQRLADAGYLVLLPDLFYRYGPYPPIDIAAVFASGSVREVLGPLMATTGKGPAAKDTAAFLDWFDSRADFAGGKLGVTGYCMGGGIALTVAGTYPDRIGAAASFHGGNLATDEPDSPHLLAPRIKAKVYVGGADQDAGYPPEQQARLDAALTAAGVDHTCEIYPGALHGWVMSDMPVFNPPAAEKHWAELTRLFAAAVG